MLSRYAVKYPGIAHLKVETISKTIEKTIRTIQQSIRKLEELKIIERKPFTRENGRTYQIRK
ncbi:helix-turn-helix domain-containing protein [Sporosarcina sp. Marseille-Q4063]|uniref:helix-turn-helix domain-containing protein n=1 Tax=Sporosarcina sp. Marseille-Q4063 TaxID=2810514 RepID=UPI0035304797